MARDPVCGMDVEKETAAATSVYQGQVYYFCSDGCKKTFDAAPSAYATTPEDPGEQPGTTS